MDIKFTNKNNTYILNDDKKYIYDNEIQNDIIKFIKAIEFSYNNKFFNAFKKNNILKYSNCNKLSMFDIVVISNTNNNIYLQTVSKFLS